MAWLVLVVAGLLEVVWSLGSKSTKGFTVLGPSVLTGSAIVASMCCSRVLHEGAAIGGVVLHHEPIPYPRVGFLVLLVVAIVGLKLGAPTME